MSLQEICERWVDAEVPAQRTTDGQVYVHSSLFEQAMSDISELLNLLAGAKVARTNAERKARRAKKKLKGSLGDTRVESVAEQGLRQA